MNTKTCELCGKDYITEVCNECEVELTLEQRMDAIKALTAAIMKQIEELKQAFRGETVNDIPVEAFIPERKEDQIL